EVDGIVIEVPMLEREGVVRGIAALALDAREEVVDALRLAEEVQAPVLAAALAEELPRELSHGEADVGVEVADAFLPVLGERMHRVREPAAPGFEEAHAEPRVPVEDAVEDARRERHLHLVPMAEDVREDERVHLLRDAAR